MVIGPIGAHGTHVVLLVVLELKLVEEHALTHPLQTVEIIVLEN